MSSPVHKHGSAAEQGAAIRRQFEASQNKRFSSQMEKDRSYLRQEQAQSPSSYQQQPSGNAKSQRRSNNRTSRSGAPPPPPPAQARHQSNRFDDEDNVVDEDERYGNNNNQQPRLAAHRDSIRRRRQIPSPPPSKAERSEAAEPRAASAAGRRQSTIQRRSMAGRGDEEYQGEDDGEAMAAASRRSGQQRRSMGGRKSVDQGAASRRKSTQTRRPYEDEEDDMDGEAYTAPRRRSTQPRRADEDDDAMAPPSGRRSRQTRRSYAGRDDDEDRGEDDDDDGQLSRKAALAGAAAAAPAASRRRSKQVPEREDRSKKVKRNKDEKRKSEKKKHRQTRDATEAPSRRRRRAEEETEEADDGGEQERTDYGGEKTGIVGGFLAKRRAAKAEAARKDAEEKEAKEQEKKAEESRSRSYSKTEKAGAGALAGGGLAAMAAGFFSRGKKQDKDKEPESDPEKQDAFTSDEAKSPDEPTDGRRRNYARREARALAAPSTVGGRTATDSEVDQREDLGDVDEEEDLEQDDEDMEQEDASEGDVTESEEGPRRSNSRRVNGAAAGTAATAAVAGGTGASAVSGSSSARRSRGPRKLEPNGRVYPLTGIDNVALLMEDQGYQTVCFSVYLFKTQLDVDTVVSFFEKLADAYPKYRYVCELDPSKANKHDKAARKGQPSAPTDFDPGRKTTYSKSLKAGSLLSPAKWRIDEDFEVGDNISFVEAEPPGDDESLFNLCGQCLSEHFDFNRPLWQAVVVHGLQTSEGARSALMIKIHHAFSDGQGMIQSYHSAIEAMQQGVSISGKQAEMDAAGGGGPKRTRRQSEKGGARREEEQKKIGSRNIKPTIGGTVSHTWHTVRGLYFRKRKAFTYPDSAGKEAARSFGAQLGKNGRPSTRFYAHSGGIAMGEIQLIRKAFSTPKMNLSLNDVACAILSRALRIAAEAQADREGEKVKDKRIAIFIPVSKRPKGDWTLANYTTGAIAWFRFHEPSTYGFEQLLSQVHREMNRIKRSHLPTLWYKVFDMACKRRLMMAPNYPIARSIFQRAYREYHVATNVPSSTKPVSFGKHKAFRYNVLPPSSPGKATLAIGMVSYAGDFSLSVSCDGVRQNQEMSEIICEAFQQAGDELIDAAEEKMRRLGK